MFLCFAPFEKSAHVAWKYRQLLLQTPDCNTSTLGQDDQTKPDAFASHLTCYWKTHRYGGEGSCSGANKNWNRHNGCGAISQLSQLQPLPCVAEKSKPANFHFEKAEWLPLLPQYGPVSIRPGRRHPSWVTVKERNKANRYCLESSCPTAVTAGFHWCLQIPQLHLLTHTDTHRDQALPKIHFWIHRFCRSFNHKLGLGIPVSVKYEENKSKPLGGEGGRQQDKAHQPI